MPSNLKIVLVIAAFAATPALAAPADEHAAHHPGGVVEAKPAAPTPAPEQPTTSQGCPMMQGQMAQMMQNMHAAPAGPAAQAAPMTMPCMSGGQQAGAADAHGAHQPSSPQTSK